MEQARCPVLVGRDDELARIVRLLEPTSRRDAPLVLLVGDAGVGKTRLTREVAIRFGASAVAVLWGACPQVELSLPYVPFLEAVGNYLDSTKLPWVRRRLGALASDLIGLFPILGEPAASSADPVQARLRLFEAISLLLRSIARRAGLLLVIDDLHWGDTTTRELLDFVLRRLRGERCLIVATCRPEALHGGDALALAISGWTRSGLASVIELAPLGPVGVDQMVTAMLPATHVTSEMRNLIYERSEGNPYVVEELVRTLLDRAGRPTLSEAGALGLPSTVRDMVVQRVNKLSEQQSRMLGLAATLGKSFDREMVVALAGGEEGVDAALAACVALQLLELEPDQGERYRFRHERTRRVVYNSVPRSLRKRLHLRAADVLTGLPDTPAVDLAYHLLQADESGRAVPFCIKAAEEAQRRGGYHEAADLYERVLPWVTNDLIQGQVEGALGYVLLLQRDPGRAIGHLAEGVRLLEASDQPVAAARYRLALGRCHWERSRPDLARDEYEAVRVRLEALGPSEELAQALVLLAGLADFSHDFERALELSRLAVKTATAAGAGPPLHAARTRLGTALANLGHVEEGLQHLDRAYADALSRQQYSNAEGALYNSIVVRWQNGRAREALALVPRLRELQGERSQDLASFAEGAVAMLVGELGRAERALDAALGRAEQAELTTLVRWIQIRLAWLHTVKGRPDLATAELPTRDARREQQEMLALHAVAIHVMLDAGRLPEALREAEAAMGTEDWGTAATALWLYDAAVEALLAGGRVDDARRLAARSQGAEDPYQARMEGRIALAVGANRDARAMLRRAAEQFEHMGYLVEEHPTRLELAKALVRCGERPAAVAELQRVLDWAVPEGAVRDAELARKQLILLGLDSDSRRPAGFDGLSRREWEVAGLVAAGLSNRGIAERLSISERTAEGHLERIRDRLGCRSRAEIASWYTRHSAGEGRSGLKARADSNQPGT